jgi:GDP-L-fucose synthase
MLKSLTDQRVMVTGGSGFLGSHLVDALRAQGVSSITVPRSREVDLTDAAATLALFRSERPDLVFHLGARVGGIGLNRRLPGSLFRDNMAMGLNVLEAARLTNTKKVLIAGTVCAYPKFAPCPFKEDDLWNGYPEETNAPYGVAKKALLVMAQSYRQEFGSNFVVLFPVNLYGPRDNFHLEDSHVIPAMIRKFVEAKAAKQPKVVLWGDGTPTREFLHVSDAARAFILAAERYDGADPVNLGTGSEISMRDLAALIAETTGYTGEVVWDSSRPNGQPRRVLDTSRARERFGFTAEVPLADGIRKTIAWFTEHAAEIAQRETAVGAS